MTLTRLRSQAIVLLLGLSTGCGKGVNEDLAKSTSALTNPALNFTVTIQTPHLVSPQTVTLGSADSLLIGGATKILRPGTLPSVISNLGANGVDAEPAAVLGEVHSTSTVTLKDRVHATGKVFAPKVIPGNSVLIDGGVDTATAQTPATVTTWTVTYPATAAPNVTLSVNQTDSRAAGRYGSVVLYTGAKLTLTTGVYYLDSLDLEPSSKLMLNQDAGPVLIYVRNSPTLRGSIATTSGSPPDPLLGYLGTAEAIVEMPFTGTIVAPSAKLTLRSVSGGYTGAFFGKSIEVGPNTSVTFHAPHVILTTQPPGSPDTCSAAIQPDPSLTGNAREVQYQKDIIRFCTGIGISACEQTIRARMNVDFVIAAASIYASRISTGTYIAVLRDRESKIRAFRKNPTLACDVAAHDGDGDFVPDSTDACKNTPPLTPVTDNGCTRTSVPPGPDITQVQQVMTQIGVNTDPRCANAPEPAVPSPLGAFRFPSDPSQGKAIWITRDSGVTDCPLYYQVEVQLTDGSGARPLTFLASEDTTLPWISAPQGAVQFSIHASDTGNRGAWASYAVFTNTFRVRAFNFAGQRSAWSDYFNFLNVDCVAGQACQDQ